MHEDHETSYGKYWEIDSAVEDEKRRVGCAGGSILRLNQDYFLLYTEETFQSHIRKIEGLIHDIHWLFYQSETGHNHEQFP